MISAKLTCAEGFFCSGYRTKRLRRMRCHFTPHSTSPASSHMSAGEVSQAHTAFENLRVSYLGTRGVEHRTPPPFGQTRYNI